MEREERLNERVFKRIELEAIEADTKESARIRAGKDEYSCVGKPRSLRQNRISGVKITLR